MSHVKIVLIGFMGSGKSSVGRALAAELDVGHLDMDSLIEEEFKMPIAQFFEQHGDEAFRRYETSVAKMMAHESNAVISTGGGAVTDAGSMEALQENATVVYLRERFETAKERCELSTRPLFKDLNAAEKLYKERLPIYRSYADITVDVDEISIDEIVSKIMEQLYE